MNGPGILPLGGESLIDHEYNRFFVESDTPYGAAMMAASGYLDTLLTQAGSPTEPNTKGTTVKTIDNKHVNNYETSSCDGGRRLGYD